MRIIGGKYRGRNITPPHGFNARPTTDYARESLFNILTNRYNFEECDMLDLFAGTGSISYEFASRGARSVEFVELNRRNYKFIINSFRTLGYSSVTSYHTDTRIYLCKSQKQFDIIFADPPYDLIWLKDLPSLVQSANILRKGGVMIIEHPGSVDFRSYAGFVEHRYYGSVNFSFFSFEGL